MGLRGNKITYDVNKYLSKENDSRKVRVSRSLNCGVACLDPYILEKSSWGLIAEKLGRVCVPSYT